LILISVLLPKVERILLIECTNIVPINPGQGIKEKDPFPIVAKSLSIILSIFFPKEYEFIVGQYWCF
jgi:hypothetical protein